MSDITQAPLVLLERGGPVVRLTLNRPDRLNAFNRALHADLAAALSDIENDPPHVLVVTGAGRGFCSGQDLKERLPQILSGESLNIAASMDETYNPLIRRMAALPCLIIAAVNGVAAGAGLGLALSADIIIAAKSARFVLAFGKVGLGPDAGVSWALPKLIGKSNALAAIMTAEAISAEDACRRNMIWKVVPDEDLQTDLQDLVDGLVKGSRAAQLASKRLIMHPSETLDAQLNRERDEQDELGQSAFYRDAVLAFSAKSLDGAP